MIRPPYLTLGDKIAIAAPARKVTLLQLQPAISLFESWGLEVVLPEHLFDDHHQFAGDDSVRAELFQNLLDDESIKAIVCAKGGYGSVRVIDRLDFSNFKRSPKWIVGYSDVTVFHSHIHSNVGVETIHGTMPLNVPEDWMKVDYPAITSLRKALFGEGLSYTQHSHIFDRKGMGEGQLIGGNLSILYSLCGSPSAIDTCGKILFIEDLDEYLYHIDRMMLNLKRNGMLSHLAGLVVGRFSDMHDNAIPFGYSAEEIIRETVDEYDFPVCFGFQSGHIGTENLALVMGSKVCLNVSETVSLDFAE